MVNILMRRKLDNFLLHEDMDKIVEFNRNNLLEVLHFFFRGFVVDTSLLLNLLDRGGEKLDVISLNLRYEDSSRNEGDTGARFRNREGTLDGENWMGWETVDL